MIMILEIKMVKMLEIYYYKMVRKQYKNVGYQMKKKYCKKLKK